MNRKTFLRQSGAIAAGLAVMPSFSAGAITLKSKVRIGMIGTGFRGQGHLDLLLRRDDVEVVAMCDIDPRMLASAEKIINTAGARMPRVFTGSQYAWQELIRMPDLDAVVISTPWEWHTQMIVESAEAGIPYIGTEVVLGITVDDHWKVVKTAEKTGSHVCMLENVCYRRDVMAVLQMVRDNVFGEIIHLQGGYQHDLREVKFNDGVNGYGGGCEFNEKGFSEARWRTQHSVTRNGDLYPTHGIGPVAEMININRGNLFTSLTSHASKSRGLHNHVVRTCGQDHPNAGIKFSLGDVVTTTIECENGETILLQHDTNLPRPYSLGFRVQGTHGLWMDINKSLFVEGKSPAHQWEPAQPWLEKYDHPLWARHHHRADGAGHGGMDFFVLHMFVESIKKGLSPQMDVYDAAAWSVITPLSEISIMNGNQSVEFPDFTNGQWKMRKPVFAFSDEF